MRTRTEVTAEPEVKRTESPLPRSLGDWHSERWERGPHALQRVVTLEGQRWQHFRQPRQALRGRQ